MHSSCTLHRALHCIVHGTRARCVVHRLARCVCTMRRTPRAHCTVHCFAQCIALHRALFCIVHCCAWCTAPLLHGARALLCTVPLHRFAFLVHIASCIALLVHIALHCALHSPCTLPCALLCTVHCTPCAPCTLAHCLALLDIYVDKSFQIY